ncbi:MAG TPA: flagellar biosynthetic protein FliO [Bryobacteraceae bacterium]|jgi:flagellar biogenesis protein FliO|nr:flagellar biosynthetic protein FliO [Bryobacteraceae bacterium]
MQLTEQIGMVLLVFALLGGLLWFSKRRGLAAFPMGARRGGNGRRLELLERVSLTPQHALHLVRVADRTVLIATAPSSCTLLDAPVNLEALSATQSRDLLRSGQ